MRIKRFTFVGYNNYNLNAIIWLPEETPKKIIQITHGMTEHIGRYSDLAKVLTSNGIALAGFDLRGHGKNSTKDCASLGLAGWDNTISDIHLFYNYLSNLYPGVPYFMMGFSLGSFLVREYLNIYQDNISGAIIMGTGYQPKIVLSIMISIIKMHIKKIGFDNTSNLVKQLSFEIYNKNFSPNATQFDWLCSDKKELYDYLNDDLCNKNISAGLLYDILNSMKRTGNDDSYKNWNKYIPILLISGMEDPVGNFGRGILKVKEKMKDNSIHNVTTFLLFDARHDILHEKINGSVDYVYSILLEWLNNIRV